MYPKTFTSRYDHKSQVVIANAEQEAQLPDEYLPDSASGLTGTASSGNSQAAGQLLDEREKLERDRTEFAKYVAEQEKKLADDRRELTEGYKASVDQFEADRAAHAAEVEAFNKAKEGGQTSEQATAPTTAPTKRGRPAKAD